MRKAILLTFLLIFKRKVVFDLTKKFSPFCLLLALLLLSNNIYSYSLRCVDIIDPDIQKILSQIIPIQKIFKEIEIEKNFLYATPLGRDMNRERGDTFILVENSNSKLDKESTPIVYIKNYRPGKYKKRDLIITLDNFTEKQLKYMNNLKGRKIRLYYVSSTNRDIVYSFEGVFLGFNPLDYYTYYTFPTYDQKSFSTEEKETIIINKSKYSFYRLLDLINKILNRKKSKSKSNFYISSFFIKLPDEKENYILEIPFSFTLPNTDHEAPINTMELFSIHVIGEGKEKK